MPCQQHISKGTAPTWAVLEVPRGSRTVVFGVICLSSSPQGAGTDERTLTRIMISRSEIDLLNIRGEFVDLFDKSLHHMIEVRGQGHPSPAQHLVRPGPRALI